MTFVVETPIHMEEGRDDIAELWITRDGAAYDLTDVTAVELYVKNNRAEADSAARFRYTSSVSPPAGFQTQIVLLTPLTAGKLQIRGRAADLIPGVYWYHIRALKTQAPNGEPLARGPFVVEDV